MSGASATWFQLLTNEVPSSAGTPQSKATASDCGGSDPGSDPGSWFDYSVGRHYNPTENWMIWTNSSYSPKRRNGRARQALRLHWAERNDGFGYF